MQVTTTSFTIAEYCNQMSRGEIVVNHEYQRSQKVWPPAARSYLIDTVLLGFPIPKLTLYQKTDLRSRQTVKEIVDGQQRSQALCSYLSGRFRLSVRSPNAGRRFSQLDEADQRRFLEYGLSADILVAASEAEIRQLFRRINSYTIPLNDQETRHAVYQGAFKWFVVDLSERYAQALKQIGVFGERQLTRMADAQLFAELIRAHLDGIATSQAQDIEDMYRRYEDEFPEQLALNERFSHTFDRILAWEDLHRGPLMRPYNFYSLFLAVSHVFDPVPSLRQSYPIDAPREVDEALLVSNLSVLAEALEDPESYPDLADFVEAASQATNVGGQRAMRFAWFCRASEGTLLR